MDHASKKTTDHGQIRRWAEERQGWPATVKGTSPSHTAGLLRIGFSQTQESSLEPISWEAFFEKFDQQQLVFLYQDHTQKGDISRFFKFVRRQ